MPQFTLLNPENIARRRPLIVYLHRYPPENERINFPGMPEFFRRALEKFDILYVSMRGMQPINPELRQGLRFIEIPFVINPGSGLSKLCKTMLFYAVFPLVLRRVRQAKPDLILCKESLPLLPILVGRLGIPILIGSVSDFWWRVFLGGSRWGRRMAGFLERAEIKRWNHDGAWAVANTKAEVDLMVDRGMNRSRIALINTTYRPGLYGPCDASVERRQMGFAPSDWVLAIHGTIRPGKGYRQLLEWWRTIARLHPNWRLLIIGGAGGEAWCRRLIRRLGLTGSTHMTGWLPTAGDVNRHLNAADGLLVIRRNSDDNQGIIPSAMFNSLATGKPTVATGLKGMAEVVRHGVEGFLFTPDDFDSFRTVLEYVVAHPEEALRVGKAGMARGKECFDPEKSAVAHVELFEKLLAQAGKST